MVSNPLATKLFSPPCSSVRGTFLARTLEWVTISPPGDLPHPGIEPGSPALQADSLLLRHRGSPCHRSLEPNLGVGPAPRVSEARRRLRTTDQGRNHKLSPSAASDQSKDDCVRWNLAAKDLTPSSFPVQPKLHFTFSKAGPAPFPLCRGVC